MLNHKELMHNRWTCCPMRALTQAILDLIVHTDLEFDGSYMKHINTEFEYISNAHNIQNIEHNMVHRHHDLDLNQEYFHCFTFMTGRHIRATV